MIKQSWMGGLMGLGRGFVFLFCLLGEASAACSKNHWSHFVSRCRVKTRWLALAYQEGARSRSEDSDSLATSAGLRCRATQESQPAHAEQQQRACHRHPRPRARHALVLKYRSAS